MQVRAIFYDNPSLIIGQKISQWAEFVYVKVTGISLNLVKSFS